MWPHISLVSQLNLFHQVREVDESKMTVKLMLRLSLRWIDSGEGIYCLEYFFDIEVFSNRTYSPAKLAIQLSQQVHQKQRQLGASSLRPGYGHPIIIMLTLMHFLQRLSSCPLTWTSPAS